MTRGYILGYTATASKAPQSTISALLYCNRWDKEPDASHRGISTWIVLSVDGILVRGIGANSMGCCDCFACADVCQSTEQSEGTTRSAHIKLTVRISCLDGMTKS